MEKIISTIPSSAYPYITVGVEDELYHLLPEFLQVCDIACIDTRMTYILVEEHINLLWKWIVDNLDLIQALSIERDVNVIEFRDDEAVVLGTEIRLDSSRILDNVYIEVRDTIEVGTFYPNYRSILGGITLTGLRLECL